MIPRETIQQIYDAVRIDEVVGDFVTLKRRGVNLLGNCPFHNERTPSFTVSPSKGIFKCFGCGKGGDSVNFVMEHEHFTYPEALKYLARKYGIEVVEEEQTPEQIRQMNEQEAMYHVSDFAQKYFSKNLFEHELGRAVGLSYFKERGLTEATIKKFQLGYCLDEWEAFTKEALKNGYNKDYLVKTGLTIEKEDGKVFDRFKGRVMFPIHNLSGRVIGFGGRILSSDKSKAKYMNSPESEIYNKSKTLYGIPFAKSEIVKKDNCYLVEGNMDVVSLHQAGIENVVASSGTAFTLEQIKTIKRFTNNITVLFDSDAAGIKASFKAIDMIVEQGMNVKVVLFPEGEDPDSYAMTHRTLEVQEFLEKEAVDFIKFKIKILSEEAAGDPIKRADMIKNIVHSISLIPDKIIRSVYIQESSSLLQMEEKELIDQLNKNIRERFRKENPQEAEATAATEEKQPKQTPTVIQVEPDTPEREIIRILLEHGQKTTKQSFPRADVDPDDPNVPEADKFALADVNVTEFIVMEIMNDEMDFTNPVYKEIFDHYKKASQENKEVDVNTFIQHELESVRTCVTEILTPQFELSPTWAAKNIYVRTENDDIILNKDVLHAVLAFKLHKIDKMLLDHKESLKTKSDHDDALEILAIIKVLEDHKMKLSSGLRRIVTK